MSNNENKNEIIQRVSILINLLKEGRYNEIDLAIWQEDTPEVAENLRQFIHNLENTCTAINQENSDYPVIQQHLDHISRTTEEGVLTVINTAESLMNECANAQEMLNTMDRRFNENEEIRSHVQNMGEIINVIQDKCFSIITAVEFDDINRQLMAKILSRLDQLSVNLKDNLASLNRYQPLPPGESPFLEDLKHIIDLDGTKRETQESVDELFETF